MARLIIDDKVRNIFKDIPESEELFERIAYKFGGNNEVNDTDERQIKFGSSDIPIFVDDIEKQLVEVTKYIDTGSSVSTIVTPNGNTISVHSGVVAAFKSLLLYTVVCNSILGSIIIHVVREYGKHLDNKDYKFTPYTEVVDGKVISYDKLTSYVREFVNNYVSRQW